jgi:hypothetical protein
MIVQDHLCNHRRPSWILENGMLIVGTKGPELRLTSHANHVSWDESHKTPDALRYSSSSHKVDVWSTRVAAGLTWTRLAASSVSGHSSLARFKVFLETSEEPYSTREVLSCKKLWEIARSERAIIDDSCFEVKPVDWEGGMKEWIDHCHIYI